MVIAANGSWNVPIVLTVECVEVVITVSELTLFLMVACSMFIDILMQNVRQ